MNVSKQTKQIIDQIKISSQNKTKLETELQKQIMELIKNKPQKAIDAKNLCSASIKTIQSLNENVKTTSQVDFNLVSVINALFHCAYQTEKYSNLVKYDLEKLHYSVIKNLSDSISINQKSDTKIYQKLTDQIAVLCKRFQSENKENDQLFHIELESVPLSISSLIIGIYLLLLKIDQSSQKITGYSWSYIQLAILRWFDKNKILIEKYSELFYKNLIKVSNDLYLKHELLLSLKYLKYAAQFLYLKQLDGDVYCKFFSFCYQLVHTLTKSSEDAADQLLLEILNCILMVSNCCHCEKYFILIVNDCLNKNSIKSQVLISEQQAKLQNSCDRTINLFQILTYAHGSDFQNMEDKQQAEYFDSLTSVLEGLTQQDSQIIYQCLYKIFIYLNQIKDYSHNSELFSFTHKFYQLCQGENALQVQIHLLLIKFSEPKYFLTEYHDYIKVQETTSLMKISNQFYNKFVWLQRKERGISLESLFLSIKCILSIKEGTYTDTLLERFQIFAKFQSQNQKLFEAAYLEVAANIKDNNLFDICSIYTLQAELITVSGKQVNVLICELLCCLLFGINSQYCEDVIKNLLKYSMSPDLKLLIQDIKEGHYSNETLRLLFTYTINDPKEIDHILLVAILIVYRIKNESIQVSQELIDFLEILKNINARLYDALVSKIICHYASFGDFSHFFAILSQLGYASCDSQQKLLSTLQQILTFQQKDYNPNPMPLDDEFIKVFKILDDLKQLAYNPQFNLEISNYQEAQRMSSISSAQICFIKSLILFIQGKIYDSVHFAQTSLKVYKLCLERFTVNDSSQFFSKEFIKLQFSELILHYLNLATCYFSFPEAQYLMRKYHHLIQGLGIQRAIILNEKLSEVFSISLGKEPSMKDNIVIKFHFNDLRVLNLDQCIIRHKSPKINISQDQEIQLLYSSFKNQFETDEIPLLKPLKLIAHRLISSKQKPDISNLNLLQSKIRLKENFFYTQDDKSGNGFIEQLKQFQWQYLDLLFGILPNFQLPIYCKQLCTQLFDQINLFSDLNVSTIQLSCDKQYSWLNNEIKFNKIQNNSIVDQDNEITQSFVQDEISFFLDQDNFVKLPPNLQIIQIVFDELNQLLHMVKIVNDQKPTVFSRKVSNKNIQEAINQFKDVINESENLAINVSRYQNKLDQKKWWDLRFDLDCRLKDTLNELEIQLFGSLVSAIPIYHRGQMYLELKNDLEKVFSDALNMDTFCIQEHLVELCYGLEADDDEYLIQDFIDLVLFNCQSNRQFKIKASAKKKLIDRIRNLLNNTQPEYDIHTALIIDSQLQCIPLESIPCLRDRSTSRILSWSHLKDLLTQSQSYTIESRDFVFNQDQVSYVINPGGDLKDTEKRITPILKNHKNWQTTLQQVPQEREISSLLNKSDVYIYIGHGNGEKYTNSDDIRNLDKCAISFLFGCSSGKLKQYEKFLPYGSVYDYLLAGSPCIVANLWDVTDKELDKLSVNVLLHAGIIDYKSLKGTYFQELTKPLEILNIPKAVSQSRDNCKLPYHTGASMICYGLPVRRKKASQLDCNVFFSQID